MRMPAYRGFRTPKQIVLTAAALLVFAFPASAARISTEREPGSEVTIISIEGQLFEGDEEAFLQQLLVSDEAIVMLESPGGDLLAGLAIGRAIRLKDAATLVPDGATCASACGLAWLGGVRRFLAPGAKIGFHAAYYMDTTGTPIEKGSANALIGKYLSELGLSTKAIVYVTDAAPTRMQWLTPDDSESFGIQFEPFGHMPESSANPSARVSSPGQILPHSSERLLSRAELSALTADQLRIARNEIFARHGYSFRDPVLQSHFSRYSWYRPSSTEVELSPLERRNVEIIRSLE